MVTNITGDATFCKLGNLEFAETINLRLCDNQESRYAPKILHRLRCLLHRRVGAKDCDCPRSQYKGSNQWQASEKAARDDVTDCAEMGKHRP